MPLTPREGPLWRQIVLKDILFVIIGSLLSAIAFNTFLIPNHLLSGGIGGVALLIYYLTGWNTSFVYILLNIPIFLIASRFIGNRFVVYSLVGTLAFSFFLSLTSTLPAVLEDYLLGGILGGILHGIGAGIVFRARGSTGGVDIIAVAFKKWKGYSIGQITLAFNVLIVGIFGLMIDLSLAVYTLISMYLTSSVLDSMESGLDEARLVTIITAETELIAQNVMSQMHRGVTFLRGVGAYTGKDQQVILCAVSPTEIPRLKELVFALDDQAFFIISNIKEVVGKGFKPEPFEY